jgi:serine/threonine protein kinase/transcription initiation factor IIE alpha subunit
MTGQQILNYRIEQKANWGENNIFLASHVATGKKAVVELLLPRSAVDSGEIEKIKAELQQLVDIQHPFVASLLEFAVWGKGFVLVYAYAEGQTLDEYIRSTGASLSEHILLNLFLKIVEAVSYLHHRNIQHLSINPFNIIISNDTPCILATGLQQIRTRFYGSQVATITEAVCYLSPEQLKRVIIDKRSDIYSLGALLFFMYTGKHPYCQDAKVAEHDVYRKIISDSLPPIVNYDREISDKVQLAIDKATEKDPNRRYSSSDAFSGAVSVPKKRRIVSASIASLTDPHARAKQVLSAEHPAPHVRPGRRLNRNVILAFLLIILLAAAIISMLSGRGGYAETNARGSIIAFFDALSARDVDKIRDSFAPVTERYYRYSDYPVESIMANYEKFWQVAPIEKYQLDEKRLSVIKQRDGTFDVMATVLYDVVILKPYDIFSYDAFKYQTKNIETEQSKEITYRIRLNKDLKIIYIVEHKSQEIPGKIAELLSRKWRLARFYDKDIDKSTNTLADKIKYQVQKFMENNYIQFNKDGTYEESLMLGDTKRGVWKISPDEETVFIKFPNSQSRFNLVEVGRNYLIISRIRDSSEVITVYRPYE